MDNILVWNRWSIKVNCQDRKRVCAKQTMRKNWGKMREGKLGESEKEI